MNKASITETMVTIPTYPLASPEKSPLFIEKRAYQGSTGKVYPLPVTEKIGNTKELKQYKALILENDFIYVMILPELGGRILEHAIDTLGKAPMANYYLGCLLYDKKQYDRAIACWENTVSQKHDFALAHRNLSIAYYNKRHDLQKALSAIQTACMLDANNSRFLLEQDQLFAKAELPFATRLSILERHGNLIEERDTLCLAYIKLLNLCGRYTEASALLEKHTFHVWEGGEGKVAEQYKISLFALAEKEIGNKNYEKAIALCKKTLVYPDNLGEGKLFNVPDNKAYYLIGACYSAMNQTDKANTYLELAMQGSIIPEPVRYYNDQPSDYIYYIGLAHLMKNHIDKAKECFESLVNFGKANLNNEVKYDYFAVSMPELEVYQDDIQKRNDDYCRMLTKLGEKGLALL